MQDEFEIPDACRSYATLTIKPTASDNQRKTKSLVDRVTAFGGRLTNCGKYFHVADKNLRQGTFSIYTEIDLRALQKALESNELLSHFEVEYHEHTPPPKIIVGTSAVTLQKQPQKSTADLLRQGYEVTIASMNAAYTDLELVVTAIQQELSDLRAKNKELYMIAQEAQETTSVALLNSKELAEKLTDTFDGTVHNTLLLYLEQYAINKLEFLNELVKGNPVGQDVSLETIANRIATLQIPLSDCKIETFDKLFQTYLYGEQQRVTLGLLFDEINAIHKDKIKNAQTVVAKDPEVHLNELEAIAANIRATGGQLDISQLRKDITSAYAEARRTIDQHEQARSTYISTALQTLAECDANVKQILALESQKADLLSLGITTIPIYIQCSESTESTAIRIYMPQQATKESTKWPSSWALDTILAEGILNERVRELIPDKGFPIEKTDDQLGLRYLEITLQNDKKALAYQISRQVVESIQIGSAATKLETYGLEIETHTSFDYENRENGHPLEADKIQGTIVDIVKTFGRPAEGGIGSNEIHAHLQKIMGNNIKRGRFAAHLAYLSRTKVLTLTQASGTGAARMYDLTTRD